MPVTKTESKALSNDETLTAILSYINILVLIPLFAIEAKKRNEFIKFHLEQGINLFIIEIILWIILLVLGFITLGFIYLISWIIWLLVLIVCIVAIIKAINKEKWEIPLISQIKIVKL